MVSVFAPIPVPRLGARRGSWGGGRVLDLPGAHNPRQMCRASVLGVAGGLQVRALAMMLPSVAAVRNRPGLKRVICEHYATSSNEFDQRRADAYGS